MATFTSKASGNWPASGQTTWNESGVPGVGDTVTINPAHTVVVNTNTSTGGMVMNGPVPVSTNVSFTVAGNVTQGNAQFTLEAGADLIFSGANRVWTMGNANSQTGCRILINGGSGNRCTVTAATGAYAIFDGDAGAVNCGGWEVYNCDFSGIRNSAGTIGIRSADFGIHDRIFQGCTFNDCGTWFEVIYNWAASSNASWVIQNCRWDNSPSGSLGLRYVFGGTGIGTKLCSGNSFGERADGGSCGTFGGYLADFIGNFFGSTPSFIGVELGLFLLNTIRSSSATCRPYLSPTKDFRPCYFLVDHVDESNRILGTTSVGNPHCLEFFGGGGTVEGVIFDYPHDTTLIDQGDGIYGTEDGSFAGTTIKNCLSIPSISDGGLSTNIHPFIHGNTRVNMYHNTAVGTTAQMTFNERLMIVHGYPSTATAQAGGVSTITLDPSASSVDDIYNNHLFFTTGGSGAGQRRFVLDYDGPTKVLTVSQPWSVGVNNTTTYNIQEICVTNFKSNLIAGVSQSGREWGAGAYANNNAIYPQYDQMIPQNIQYNALFMPVPASYNPGEGVTADGADGYHIHLTSPPDGTNMTITDPLFRDTTRNAARWAVYRGYVGAEPTHPAGAVSYTDPTWIIWLTWKRAALDAVYVALMNDPTLGYSSLYPWVQYGYEPLNPSVYHAGHDGETIGAVSVSGSPPPDPDPPPPSSSSRTARIGRGGSGRSRRV